LFYKVISLFGFFSYFNTTASKCRHNLIKYNYRNQIKKNEMGERVAHLGEKREAYRALVGKHEEKRPLGRPRRRWEDNIKKDNQKIEWGIDWIGLVQEGEKWLAVVMNRGLPYSSGNLSTS
jgi:hypothetical protein